MNDRKTEKFIGIVNDINDKTPYCFDCENINTRNNCIICIDKNELPKNIEIKDSTEYLIEVIKDNNGNIEIYYDEEEEGEICYEYSVDGCNENCEKYQLVNFDLYNNSKNEKINSQKCKEEIIKYCLQNKNKIVNEFIPPLDETQFSEILKIKNWKRQGKRIDQYLLGIKQEKLVYGNKYIERIFDCIFFEDELRGYVETNLDDTIILNLYVQGE